MQTTIQSFEVSNSILEDQENFSYDLDTYNTMMEENFFNSMYYQFLGTIYNFHMKSDEDLNITHNVWILEEDQQDFMLEFMKEAWPELV